MNYHKGIATRIELFGIRQKRTALSRVIWLQVFATVEKPAAYYITNLQVTFVGLVHAFED